MAAFKEIDFWDIVFKGLSFTEHLGAESRNRTISVLNALYCQILYTDESYSILRPFKVQSSKHPSAL